MTTAIFNDKWSEQREYVTSACQTATAKNNMLFKKGDITATAEYIFSNQKEDAFNIVDIFYKKKCRVVSIQKKTKVGADGLMIELAKVLTTHNDKDFVVNIDNVRILTGMSNAGWEKDMINKSPECFKDKIFHHGKLKKAGLNNIYNGLFIIDEIDTGDKEGQILHQTLRDAGILDVKHMEEHNNMFVFISATMIRELYSLYKWGKLHELYKMTIPDAYIGHKELLNMGIIKEFYPLNCAEYANKWVTEDIIDNYGDAYRVHIVRSNKKNIDFVENACIKNGIAYRNHTSTDRLSLDEINELFKKPLTKHIVLGVKGFFRRANLIPNEWKLRIGATHELHTKKIDNSVQIQGLPGRMTGYWGEVIRKGHRTGPHRTSIKAVEEYEKTYDDPFGKTTYNTAGFTKKNGKVTENITTMLAPKHILNIEAIDLPVINEESKYILATKEFDNFDDAKQFIIDNNSQGRNKKSLDKSLDNDGFIKSSTSKNKSKLFYNDVKQEMSSWSKTSGFDLNKNLKKKNPSRIIVCYKDVNDNKSTCFIVRVLKLR